jgi:hypothetical protein
MAPWCGVRIVAGASIHSLVRQACGKRLSDGLRDGGSVMRETRQPRTQRTFACRIQFAADRIVVVQSEPA